MKKHKIFLHTILLFCIVLLFSFLIPSFTKIIRHNIQLVQATSALEAPLSPEEQKAKEIASRSKYDAREDKIVPPVRNQGSWNLCWAYSATALAEINILKHGYETDVQNIEFIPQNLSRNMFNRLDDPLHNTFEDVYTNQEFDKGYWVESVSFLLTQWRGLTSGWTDLSYNNKYILQTAKTKITNDTQSIKNAVATYGSVAFMYKAPGYGVTHYYPTTLTNPHESVIIGWDDSIAKTNFSPQPKHDGAWLVRNSWGTGAHNKGYFYISYDSVINDLTVFDFAPKDGYDNNYFYDANCNQRFTSFNQSEYTKMANIFEVKKNTTNTEESLKAVNIGVNGENIDAEIQIYTGLSSLHAAPDSGTLCTTIHTNFTNSGMYTVNLDSPLSLENTQYFSVVVKISNAKHNAAFLTEFSNTSTYDFSYYWERDSSSWKDLKTYLANNVARIKAYTQNTPRTSSVLNDLKYAIIENTSPYNVDYTGQPQYPIFKVTFNNTTLLKNVDYTVMYKDNLNAGIAKAVITGIGKYSGTKTATWTITKPKFPPNVPGEIIKGNPRKRALYVSSDIENYAQIPLADGWHWFNTKISLKTGENQGNTVIYKDSKNYQTSSIDMIVYKEEKVATSLQNADVTFLKNNYTYTGYAITPQVQVLINNVPLVCNTDYIVNYNNNINAGTAQLTIQGIGQYTDSITKNFTIEKAERPYSNPPSTLTIHADTDLTTVDFGSDWQLVDSNTTIAVGETKDIEVIHKNAHNYKTGTTATVRITRLQASTPPITTPQPPTPQPPTPQPTPPITSPSDSQTTTTTKNNAYLFFSVGGGVLVLIGAISLTIFFIKRKK